MNMRFQPLVYGAFVAVIFGSVPGAILTVPIAAIIVIVLPEYPDPRPIAVLLSRNGRL
jgi:hypothetical protein